MPAEAPQPPADNGSAQESSAQAMQPVPERFAVSPGVGGLPSIYVSQSSTRAGTDLWLATIRAARRAARRLPPHHSAAELRAMSEHHVTGEAMTDIPADLRYGKDHLWVRSADSGLVRVGVTDFAQQSLGDVVDVNPPRPGATVTAGEPCGDIESTKSVNDLIAPVTGTVRASNDELADSPELVNADPYGRGWMFEVETDPASQAQQLAALMDATAYREMTGG